MKLYLLRHEKRSLRDPTFHSPLLQNGLRDAEKLKYLLDDLNINLIFSSPFIKFTFRLLFKKSELSSVIIFLFLIDKL